MPDHRVLLSRRHTCPLWPVVSSLYPLLPGWSQVYTLFSHAGTRRPIPHCPQLGRPTQPTLAQPKESSASGNDHHSTPWWAMLISPGADTLPVPTLPALVIVWCKQDAA